MSASRRLQTKTSKTKPQGQEKLSAFAPTIIQWFRANARPLPWRKTSDPYRIWISEMMCQQTGVQTVIPYYERFLKRFPNLEALARSKEETVIKLWEGLGYYHRARNLRKAAQMIVLERAGKFPSNLEDLLSLPGIGRYSAGAILSLAYRKPTVTVDGNYIRVFSRYFGIIKATDDPKVLKEIWTLAGEALPKSTREIRDYTEGVMDFGASLCKPKNPECSRCPLKASCYAFEHGIQSKVPIKLSRRERIKKVENVFWVENRGKVLIYPKGSDLKFPYFHRLPFDENQYELQVHGEFKYSITIRDIKVRLYKLKRALPHMKGGKWLAKNQLARLSVPAIDRKIIEACR